MKIALSICLALVANHVLATDNYCHDPESNVYWDNLAIRAADHIDVINLVMLRKQLCGQINTGKY